MPSGIFEPEGAVRIPPQLCRGASGGLPDAGRPRYILRNRVQQAGRLQIDVRKRPGQAFEWSPAKLVAFVLLLRRVGHGRLGRQ